MCEHDFISIGKWHSYDKNYAEICGKILRCKSCNSEMFASFMEAYKILNKGDELENYDN